MGFLSKLAGGVGTILSKATGAEHLTNLNYANQKEAMQNSVQWHAADLDKAGFNRILAAGGTGATNGGAGGAAGGVGNPMDLINTAVNSAKSIKDMNLLDSQKDLNEATTAKTESETALNQITKGNLDKQQKAEIKGKEAEIANMNVDTRYQEESFNHRLTQQMAETEKSVSEGRISIDNAKFLANYGITKEQAIQLGSEGIRIIGQMIIAKAGAGEIKKAAQEILKNKKMVRNSAKREPKIRK